MSIISCFPSSVSEDDLVKYDNDEFASPLPFNADRLNGHPDSYFAKQNDMSVAEQGISSLRSVAERLGLTKVDKETGKGLSTNDYSNEEKQKVADNTTARHTHANKSILDSITQETLNDIVKYDNDEFTSPIPLNADRLNGHPDSYFAKQEALTAAEQGIASNTAARHTHSNKSILDQITQAMLDLIGTIAGKYVKPNGGIPKTDLASDVQTSLGKADSALQQHQSLAAYRTASAQDTLDAQKYSASNPPPYPVTSVNGQTGGVILNYITFDEEES